MEIEQIQAPVIEQFVKQISAQNGSSLVDLIAEATSHPSLFAFSEILDTPNLLQLQGTEYSAYIDLLRLFAYGTWSDYKSNASVLPQLLPDQVFKLKQLSVLTLAETKKVLSYDQLLEELEVPNVRELEDFLIDGCMYAGIVKGKLNQLRRCFEVQFAAGRDLKHGQLEHMIHNLDNWLATSGNLLPVIQEKIKWADTTCELERNRKKEIQDTVEEVKKSLNQKKLHSNQSDDDNDGFFDFDIGGVMDFEEDRSRTKRRRPPVYFRNNRG